MTILVAVTLQFVTVILCCVVDSLIMTSYQFYQEFHKVASSSILGPLLYINDLPEHILSSLLFLFANDTKRLKTITTFNDSIDPQKKLKFAQ